MIDGNMSHGECWVPGRLPKDLRGTEDAGLFSSAPDPALPIRLPQLQAQCLWHAATARGQVTGLAARAEAGPNWPLPLHTCGAEVRAQDKEGKDGRCCSDLRAQHTMPLNAPD